MLEKEHIQAAQQWEQVSTDNASFNFVLPQAYFYSAINYVEAILASKNIHPRNHEDRFDHMRDVNGFDQVDREIHERLMQGRREAGYRGRNGEKLRRIKQAHAHFKKKWQTLQI